MKFHVAINDSLKEVDAPNIIEAITIALEQQFGDYSEAVYYMKLNIWATYKEENGGFCL
jgi:hypothetical protein